MPASGQMNKVCIITIYRPCIALQFGTMQANIKDPMAPKVAIPYLMVQKCDHSTRLTPIVSLCIQYTLWCMLQRGAKRNAQNKHAPVRTL